MNVDIFNDETWKQLTRSAKDIPEDWDRKCEESIRKERSEVEKKYNIKIGQTNIKCVRCGRPWGFGNHTCADVRLQKLQEKKAEKVFEIGETENQALVILKDLGPKKVAIYLMISEGRVTKWAQRESIPRKYMDKILNFKECA